MSQYFDQSKMFLEPKVTQYGSHMVMTDVVMPTKSKYLNIDSRFRDTYDSSAKADYTITLPERVNNVRSLELKSLELPITFFNFSASQENNTFQLRIGASQTTIIIDDGQYDAGDLVTEVNTKLGAAGAPFTDISIAISSNVATFTNANANPCTLTFDKSDCTSPSSSLASKFGWKVGFRLNEYEIEGSGGTQSGEAIVTLYLPRYLYFIVDEFSNANPYSFFGLLQNSQISSQQILARMTIPTTFVNGELRILDQNQFMVTDVRKYSNEINIQRLHVSIVDEFGNVIDLNGADFSFCLKLTTL
jgi:hypothetical protein